MDIITGITWWMIIPVILTGIVYAAILYYKNSQLQLSSFLKWTLFAFRFTLVSLIAFLLLSPHLMQTKKVVEQPVIIIAQDNSASVALSKDSLYFKNEYPAVLQQFKDEIAGEFRMDFYTFGQQVNKSGTLDFNDQRTDISELLQSISNSYYNRNVGAVVLISDGIVNTGIQPELVATEFPFLVYSVALGDTTSYPDLSIVDVRYNQMIFNQADFPIEISFKGVNAPGTQVKIELYMEDKLIGAELKKIETRSYTGTCSFVVSASESGKKRLTAKIIPLEAESQLLNNSRVFYVDIVNEKQKVLLLSLSPHPDLGAFQSIFEDYFDVTTAYIRTFSPDDTDYSLIILHQLPGKGVDNQTIQKLLQSQSNASVLVVVGPQTDLAVFNSLQSDLQFVGPADQPMIEAYPVPVKEFALFSVESYMWDRLRGFPALTAPLVEMRTPVSFQSAVLQKVKSVETYFPLIGFSETPSRRWGYITGSGIWKWRLADYQMNGNQDSFREIIGKTVQYLLVKKDQRRLRLHVGTEFMLNEPVRFRAELYNKSMEKVNDAELKLEVKHIDSGSEYSFLFSRSDNEYELNAGRFPEGRYVYNSEVVYGSEKLQANGEFVVLESSLESRQMIANHDLLYRISKVTDGDFLYLAELNQLPETLRTNQAITSTASFTKVYDSFISLPAILMLLLLLLTLEWFIRKYNGTY